MTKMLSKHSSCWWFETPYRSCHCNAHPGIKATLPNNSRSLPIMIVSTDLPWTKWPPFSQWHVQVHFMNEKFWILISISLKFVPKGPIDSIGSGDGLAPSRQQAIIWTNDDPVRWRIYAAVVGDELISDQCQCFCHVYHSINRPPWPLDSTFINTQLSAQWADSQYFHAPLFVSFNVTCDWHIAWYGNAPTVHVMTQYYIRVIKWFDYTNPRDLLISNFVENTWYICKKHNNINSMQHWFRFSLWWYPQAFFDGIQMAWCWFMRAQQKYHFVVCYPMKIWWILSI